MSTLRPGLPALPDRIKTLPIDERGYPVPWFVSWVDGKPEFRVVDGRKMLLAVRQRRCWVCGEPLGKFMTFVIGPMCAINRISGEPPSHRECAMFSAKACPFLTRPHMARREANLPEGSRMNPNGIPRNPGVALVWTTLRYTVMQEPDQILFKVGEPTSIVCFAEGRVATKEEVFRSITSGLPILTKAAALDGDGALEELCVITKDALKLLEAHVQ